MVLGDPELIEDSIRLPPPMVFRLSEFRLPVVAVHVGILGIGAFDTLSPVSKLIPR